MKKFNKQILEAINRGVQLALDDYDFNSNDIVMPKHNVVKNQNSVKSLIEAYSQLVDLKLPSGTLWSKYNLGVDPKNLKTNEDWYGKYYQWGNIKPSKFYISSTNRYAKIVKEHGSDMVKYTKYCPTWNNSYKDRIDDFRTLQSEDDPATVILGRNFRTPSREDFRELLRYTTHKWQIRYNGIERLYGLLFKSKRNGAELFIPAGGAIIGEKHDHQDNEVCIWTNEVSDKITERAYYMYATRYVEPQCSASVREFGKPIRPVCKIY